MRRRLVRKNEQRVHTHQPFQIDEACGFFSCETAALFMGVRRLLDGPPSSRRCTTLRFVLMLSCLNFVLLLINYASSAPRSIERPSSSALLDAVRKTGILRVGSPMDYAPFAFTPCGVVDSSAAMALPAGSDIDLARALAQSLNAQMQIVATSWPHLIDDSRAGKFDIAVGGISITLERLRDVGFSASTSPPTPKSSSRAAQMPLYSVGVELDVPSTVVAVNPGGTNEKLCAARCPTRPSG